MDNINLVNGIRIRVESIFSKYFHITNTDNNKTLEMMGLGTVSMIELEEYIRNEFGIDGDINACLYNYSTINDIVESVRNIILVSYSK